MKLDETIRGFKMLLSGEVDHIPEPYFNFKGGIDEVIAAFEMDKGT